LSVLLLVETFTLNPNDDCTVADTFTQVELKSSPVEVSRSRWLGKGGIIITTDVDVPDKVLEKRIHLASTSEEKQGISVAETLGIKSKNSERVEKAYRSDRSAYCC
jgi:hypothetical protein